MVFYAADQLCLIPEQFCLVPRLGCRRHIADPRLPQVTFLVIDKFPDPDPEFLKRRGSKPWVSDANAWRAPATAPPLSKRAVQPCHRGTATHPARHAPRAL